MWITLFSRLPGRVFSSGHPGEKPCIYPFFLLSCWPFFPIAGVFLFGWVLGENSTLVYFILGRERHRQEVIRVQPWKQQSSLELSPFALGRGSDGLWASQLQGWHPPLLLGRSVPLKDFYYSRCLKGEHTTPTGPYREASVWVRRRKEPGKAWARAFIVFSAGKARQGRVKSLGLTSLNNAGRLWEGLSLSCLAPGPRLT